VSLLVDEPTAAIQRRNRLCARTVCTVATVDAAVGLPGGAGGRCTGAMAQQTHAAGFNLRPTELSQLHASPVPTAHAPASCAPTERPPQQQPMATDHTQRTHTDSTATRKAGAGEEKRGNKKGKGRCGHEREMQKEMRMQSGWAREKEEGKEKNAKGRKECRPSREQHEGRQHGNGHDRNPRGSPSERTRAEGQKSPYSGV